MKRLSDYKDEEAIDLWADLLDQIIAIFTDPEVAKMAGQPPLQIARVIVKNHKTEVTQILLRIDPTPVDGLNVIIRLVDVLNELEASPEIKSFLGLSSEKKPTKSSGSATASTKAKGK